MVRQLVRGRSNAVGTETLTANASSTTVAAPFIASAGSFVGLMPMTANAAAALATSWVTPSNGSFLVTHANNGQTDRKFQWGVIG